MTSLDYLRRVVRQKRNYFGQSGILRRAKRYGGQAFALPYGGGAALPRRPNSGLHPNSADPGLTELPVVDRAKTRILTRRSQRNEDHKGAWASGCESVRDGQVICPVLKVCELGYWTASTVCIPHTVPSRAFPSLRTSWPSFLCELRVKNSGFPLPNPLTSSTERPRAFLYPAREWQEENVRAATQHRPTGGCIRSEVEAE